MAKRRINKQQHRRIEQRRRQQMERAGNDTPEFDADTPLGPEQPGLILEHFGRQADVEDATGEVHRCHLRTHLEHLVAGDQVVFQAGEPTGVVVAGKPRRSELVRPDSSGRERAVAANIDQMIIVIAVEPPPHGNLIDRYLVAAENSELRALLLLNKADRNNTELDALLQRYRELDYPVLRSSAKTGEGLDTLREQLQSHTSIVVGQSGVGKSSLINALLPVVNARVGAMSHASAKGRHTTTSARLYHFPAGGDLIDSPGIREFSVQNLNAGQILRGFRELYRLAGDCRFRNCQHQAEPGCAILAALENGTIYPERLESYRQMLNEVSV